MVPPLADHGEGGSGLENFRAILRRVHAGNTAIAVGDLGGDPPHGAYIGGGNTTGWCGEYYEAPEATAIWGMGVTPNSGCAKGGGDWLVGDIHHTEAEHGGTFHYHPYNHGPLPVR